jgi:hypothetical protein
MGATMRIFLACVMVIGGLASAQAQVRVTGVDVLSTGLYKMEKYKKNR